MLLIGVDVPPLGPPPSIPGGDAAGCRLRAGYPPVSSHGSVRSISQRRYGSRSSRAGACSASPFRDQRSGTHWFTFSVAAAREGENQAISGGFDVAPGHGTFRYQLSSCGKPNLAWASVPE